MESNDLFEFELNEAKGYWSVTGYHGNGGELVFPSSYEGKPVKAIGDMFSPYNKRITSIIIPEGFTSIGYNAFEGCAGLTDIKLPESLVSIVDYAFKGCTGLKSIKLPKNLDSIGFSVFEDCEGLKSVKLPKNLTSIGDYSFYDCTELKNIKLPESLISIGDNAFWDCTGLTNIKLPENLTSIGFSAFQGCEGLTSIKLPESLVSIGDDVFEGCKGLTEISVDENNPAFCAVEGVLFDKAMTTLICFPGGKKGKYCVPDGVVEIRHGAFADCGELTSISFPPSLLFFERYRFNCEQLTDITVSELNTVFYSIDGVLFDKKNHALLKYPRNKDRTEYAVPDGTLYINKQAFYECKRLTNITLPESIEIIGDCAFAGCEGLKAITLPMNLQYVRERAFGDREYKGCQNLETITLSRKTKIGYKAFDGFKGRLVYRD
jgi:hypothetical protein